MCVSIPACRHLALSQTLLPVSRSVQQNRHRTATLEGCREQKACMAAPVLSLHDRVVWLAAHWHRSHSLQQMNDSGFSKEYIGASRCCQEPLCWSQGYDVYLKYRKSSFYITTVYPLCRVFRSCCTSVSCFSQRVAKAVKRVNVIAMFLEHA